jgi:hypothetical protein
MRNHRLYEVRSDATVGGWKIVTGKGTCVKRTGNRREAISLARGKAKVAAEEFGINTTLRVRDMNGTVSEERSFKAVRQ